MTHCFLSATALIAALVFGVLPEAEAVEYKQVNATASQIAFTYTQMGTQVYGTFSKFNATLDFDSSNPSAAQAALTIQLDSIDAGSSDANTELQKPGWFNTAEFPLAKFTSTSIKPVEGNRYEVSGKLTIKGQTRDVRALMVLSAQNAIGVFNGEFILKRADFNVGEGEWADYGVISNDINIKFRMVAPEE